MDSSIFDSSSFLHPLVLATYCILLHTYWYCCLLYTYCYAEHLIEIPVLMAR